MEYDQIIAEKGLIGVCHHVSPTRQFIATAKHHQLHGYKSTPDSSDSIKARANNLQTFQRTTAITESFDKLVSAMGNGTNGFLNATFNIVTQAMAPDHMERGPPPKPKEQIEKERTERLEKEANRQGPKRKRDKVKESILVPKEERRSWRGYPDEHGNRHLGSGWSGMGGGPGGTGGGGGEGDCGGGDDGEGGDC